MDSVTHEAGLAHSSGLKQPYHLVDPSPWPIVGAAGGGTLLTGIVVAAHWSNYLVLAAGVALVALTMVMWWRDVIRESRTPGLHSKVVQLGLRYGMALFIASEVMFFVGFCMPLRMSEEHLLVGDDAEHGEEAYALWGDGERFDTRQPAIELDMDPMHGHPGLRPAARNAVLHI